MTLRQWWNKTCSKQLINFVIKLSVHCDIILATAHFHDKQYYSTMISAMLYYLTSRCSIITTFNHYKLLTDPIQHVKLSAVQTCHSTCIQSEAQAISRMFLPSLHQCYICYHWARIVLIWIFIALFANLTQLPSTQDGRSARDRNTNHSVSVFAGKIRIQIDEE